MNVRDKSLFSLPATGKRVNENTSFRSNERIRTSTLKKLNEVGNDPDKIKLRLEELDREWDIERTLEANASIAALTGLFLGLTVNRKWLALPVAVTGFLLQHATQGWCPPLSVFRRWGVRTQREIDNERAILIARLGSLENLKNFSSENALSALERTYH